MEPRDDNQPLPSWIREEIARRGPVTVAQFMEWALYHPQFGYYSSGPNIGPRGDFTTSPEASPAFGRLLATHIAEIDRLLGNPADFDLIECGPGLGSLASDVLGELKESHTSLYERFRYRLVELSPALTMLQHERLLPAHDGVVVWSESLDQLPSGLRGALVANEVVDAFPVHVLENKDGVIREQYVDCTGGTDLHIAYDQPSRPELLAFLEKCGLDLKPGQRVEVNLAAGDWARQFGRVLHRGVATVIDYGSVQPERYSEARREGTLLGYFGGAVTANILARPGQQDLTSLVDFTTLADSAQAEGFTCVGLMRQANFLVGLGLGTTITAEGMGGDLRTVLAHRRGLQALVSPEGLGRFHVLLLSKGLDPESVKASLSGMKYADVG